MALASPGKLGMERNRDTCSPVRRQSRIRRYCIREPASLDKLLDHAVMRAQSVLQLQWCKEKIYRPYSMAKHNQTSNQKRTRIPAAKGGHSRLRSQTVPLGMPEADAYENKKSIGCPIGIKRRSSAILMARAATSNAVITGDANDKPYEKTIPICFVILKVVPTAKSNAKSNAE